MAQGKIVDIPKAKRVKAMSNWYLYKIVCQVWETSLGQEGNKNSGQEVFDEYGRMEDGG